MSLYRMLTERRAEILERCRQGMSDITGPTAASDPVDSSIPGLYEQLIEVMRISLDGQTAEARQQFVMDTVTASTSRQHAQEAYRNGYTVAQLVRGYGGVCQGITETAHVNKEPISAEEFSQLNLSLDVAIAQAVSEFEVLSLQQAGRDDSLRLGFLVHELRNYLSVAMMAHELVRTGGVGASGATSGMLTQALQQMKDIVDRAMVEVRLDGEPVVERIRIKLLGLISLIESSALPEANAKSISIVVEVDPSLEVEADPHLMTSAIANLLQNGIKYSQLNSVVYVRAFAQGEDAIIEIEDRCGGLPEGRAEELFMPYTQGPETQSGMGLGLPIARRAIELNGGRLSGRDLPERGCVFTVRMPVAKDDPLAEPVA